MANAFHTEEIVLTNIPVDPVPGGGPIYLGLPAGALYTTVAAPGYAARPLYIK